MDMLEKYIFLNNLVDNMGAIEPSVKDALTRLSTPTLYHGTDVRIVNMSENVIIAV
jgi:hypothetical protein